MLSRQLKQGSIGRKMFLILPEMFEEYALYQFVAKFAATTVAEEYCRIFHFISDFIFKKH